MKTQQGTLRFNAATGLKGNRFVTITHATQTAAYTSAAAAPDGITVYDERNGVIDVLPIGDKSGSFMVELAGTVSVGDQIEVGANGCGVIKSAGSAACYARLGGVSGAIIEGYNLK